MHRHELFLDNVAQIHFLPECLSGAPKCTLANPELGWEGLTSRLASEPTSFQNLYTGKFIFWVEVG